MSTPNELGVDSVVRFRDPLTARYRLVTAEYGRVTRLYDAAGTPFADVRFGDREIPVRVDILEVIVR